MSAPLWTFADFLAGTGGRPIGASPEAVTGISIDSRTIGKGDAFFAIRGDAHDGHDFVGKALAAGAATAVVARAHLSALGTVRGSLVAVDDVLEALADLGRAARSRSQARIAAVTGSVGKTSTKETLARALAGEGPVHYSPASFNNHWGVPLTLARMPADSRFAVFEIGMNHPGEITPLVKMVRPHVAIVTTVEAVHLEFFRDVAEIARAKAEIFLGVEPDGAAVINRDNPHYELLADAARAAGIAHVVGFGENREAEARLEVVKLKPECSCVSANILGEEIAYKLGAPGRHLVQNSLAVLAAVSLLGGDMAKAALALAAMPAPKGRGARFALKVKGGSATLIDESYNANPASMRAAIALLGQAMPQPRGRRIAILGDMRELGAEAPALHAGLAQPLAEAQVDLVYLAGPLMQSLWDALPPDVRGAHAASAADLLPALYETIGIGDVIMVKGSNASRMGPLAEAIRTRFAPAPGPAEQRQGQEIA
ncbi:MAG: UDP-N-acetylmuramoylalanyl-D-glutamyl-2,6-diaminopimelate--D-alanyl-D-alanine ligase [Rhizobiales bacterium]|nr:UDP-N-acetylmuramoylalanyl-D-glutamyl-2,6-diaminopimelate--D-alanyl-D-alanine ligase [Hyphomicrobiales bacterium]